MSNDTALERRFQPVHVAELSRAATLDVLSALEAPLSTHHGVLFTPAALDAAVALSDRHVADRQLPDKVPLVLCERKA